jgi:hypothetical protein
MQKVLYKHISSAALQAAENRNWIPHQVRNDRCGIDSIRGQIPRLRPAPIVLRLTPNWCGAALGMTWREGTVKIKKIEG